MKRISLLIIVIFSAFFAQAQKAKLSGKITNNKNESLIGVSIILRSDKSQATKTDIEGRYSFNIDVNKEYTITATYVGYKESVTAKIIATKEGEEKNCH